MTAEVLSLPRGGGARPAPLVPPRVNLQEGDIFLRLPPSLFDSDWAVLCTREERLAGIVLRARALKQVQNAGSLPAADRLLARAADYGDDLAGWEAVKVKALEGWVLCSDDRWHHPEIARNVLHIWIGRLEARRVSAWGNLSKGKEASDYGLPSILDDIDEALAALRGIDPQDASLRKATRVAADWRKRVTDLLTSSTPVTATVEPTGAVTPIRTPNGPPNRGPLEGDLKGREAKGNEANLKTDLPDRRSGHDLTPCRMEIEKGRGGVLQPEEIRKTYPPDAFGLWYNRFPLKEARKKAEVSFARVQASGIVSFPDLMSGLERYIRNKPKNQDWCYPATWLNEERWRDGIPLLVAGQTAASERPATDSVFVVVGTPSWEAWQKEARRLGKPGWPTIERGALKGWSFPSEWPPGHNPVAT